MERYSDEQSREEYVRSLVTEPVGMADLMAPVQDGDPLLYSKYCGALAYLLGLPPQLVGHVANLDYVEVPSLARLYEAVGRVNYMQLLTAGREHASRDSIEQVLCYLTYFREPLYDEPYQHTAEEKALLRQALASIAEKHGGSAAAYFAWVSGRLWRDASYLAGHYRFYMDCLQQRLQAYADGVSGYVFDRIDGSQVVYCR
jgi:hypothetical protein